jgi:hypothetical protein
MVDHLRALRRAKLLMNVFQNQMGDMTAAHGFLDFTPNTLFSFTLTVYLTPWPLLELPVRGLRGEADR